MSPIQMGGIPKCEPPISPPNWETTYILQAKNRQPDSQGVVPRVVFPVYESPEGSLQSLPAGYDLPQDPWVFGNRFSTLVISGSPGDVWAEIMLSTKPPSTGWVRTQHFNWIANDYHIDVDLSDNTLGFWKGDELIHFTGTIDGRPGARTPIIRTYLEGIIPNSSSGPLGHLGAGYGTYLLVLALYSEDLVSFGTSDGVQGLPQIAIHGTHIPDRLGIDISSGSIRIHNDVIDEIAKLVPLGTVVNIRP